MNNEELAAKEQMKAERLKHELRHKQKSKLIPLAKDQMTLW